MKKRKQAKNNHSDFVAIIVLVIVFIGVALLIASPSNPAHGGQPPQGEDAFYGKIENVPLRGQTAGIVKADTNCKTTDTGLTNCIGIIQASDGTELHFNYTHDMSKQACLTAGDAVRIALLSNGTTKVVRG